MRAAARANHRVNLIDDDGPDRPQHLPAALRRQQQEQRFRRRDQDMGRRAEHGGALGLAGIAGPHGRRDPRRGDAQRFRALRDAAARQREILVDVGAERLERRHVDDSDLVGQRPAQPFLKQTVERRQKRRQRLARSGRRGNQRMATGSNRLPALPLSGRRLAEVSANQRATTG